ncbi:transcription termination/antitermination protein NusG [Loktanella sp. R86503]|uniref:transcription termination/antitermination protein NusG n=1 Tax=Loktanella sp. R86503 TaxID=3093847 RepID=UPI0036DF4237
MQVTDGFQWFVAQLRPQGLARAQEHLQRQGFRTFSPEIHTAVLRSGVSRRVRKPLFPGYLFVSFDPANSEWIAINSTRGIARLISTDPRHPSPLPAALMSAIRARCDASGLLLPQADFQVGDRIRVLAGPFAHVVTTIEALPGPARIGVLMELMGGKVRTSIPVTQIQKLA